MNPVFLQRETGFFFVLGPGKRLIFPAPLGNRSAESWVKNKAKLKIKIKADPSKIRRVWKLKPVQKVQTSNRRARLSRIREREARDEAGR